MADMKKIFILTILLILSAGCQKEAAKTVADRSFDGFAAIGWDDKGNDQLVIMNENGEIIRSIQVNDNYPSAAVEVAGKLYWHNVKTVDKSMGSDFLYVNEPVKDQILSPFLINDVVAISPGSKKIMFKNGIYELEGSRYYSTNDPDFLLCDWLSEDEVLGVNARGVVLADNRLKQQQVIISDFNGTYYEAKISPDRQKIAYLRYDASNGHDYLVVQDLNTKDQLLELSREKMNISSMSKLLWLDDQRLIFQGRTQSSDIFMTDLTDSSYTNLTATPGDSESYHAMNLDKDTGTFYYLCDSKSSMKIVDTKNFAQLNKIQLQAVNIMDVNCI
jgi:hypothetical protein